MRTEGGWPASTTNTGGYDQRVQQVTRPASESESDVLALWGAVSKTVDLDGPVHYLDFGGPADGPRVVLVHGLGGSHVNWSLLGPLLAERARVLAIDLPGFGRTPPQGRPMTVHANANLLDRFVREVAGAPAILAGNSMGGMISIMESAANPDTVAGVILVDPALPRAAGAAPDRLVATAFFLYAVPGLGELYLARRRAKFPAEVLVRQTLELCCVDPSRVPADVIAASVALVQERSRHQGLDGAFLRTARSVLRLLARPTPYWEMMSSLRVPVYLFHGEQDRLVPVQAARIAAGRYPRWTFATFPDAGHVPQLEVPDAMAKLLLEWFAGAGQPAVAAASRPPRLLRS